MRYLVIVHNYLLLLQQLFLSSHSQFCIHNVQSKLFLFCVLHSRDNKMETLYFFITFPLLLFPVNFPRRKDSPVQQKSQMCNLGMV